MSRRITVAGVGNIFFGDDAFGVEVVRRLRQEHLPPEVVISDVGVRGIHLAYQLLEPMDLLVIVDLAARDGEPGSLYVIDPDLEGDGSLGTADAHGMDLPTVFAAVRTLGGEVPRVRIVGCEPWDLDPRMGLSEPVAAAIDGAVELVRELVQRELEGSAGASDPNRGPASRSLPEEVQS